MTPAEVAAIRALADAATAGPWFTKGKRQDYPPDRVYCVYNQETTSPYHTVQQQLDGHYGLAEICSDCATSFDRDFIAHSRIQVPALCDALEAAWARIAALETELERLGEAYDNR